MDGFQSGYEESVAVGFKDKFGEANGARVNQELRWAILEGVLDEFMTENEYTPEERIEVMDRLAEVDPFTVLREPGDLTESLRIPDGVLPSSHLPY